MGFGLGVSFWSFCVSKYNYQKHENNLAYFLVKQKNKAINKYLTKNYYSSTIVKEYQIENEEIPPNSILWTFWWQGEEELPDIIRVCVQSQKKYSNNHKMIMITKENIDNYVKLPSYIHRKVDNGTITITHFSDIIRVYLLSQYGGAWLDATIYLSKPITEDMFTKEYYTLKSVRVRYSCVSEFRWNGSILGGRRGNEYSKEMLRFFLNYWKKEEKIIDYFLIDYWTDILFNYNDKCKRYFEKLDVSNQSVFRLEENLDEIYSEELYLSLLEKTCIHKLARRNEHKIRKYDKLTIWGKILD